MTLSVKVSLKFLQGNFVLSHEKKNIGGLAVFYVRYQMVSGGIYPLHPHTTFDI